MFPEDISVKNDLGVAYLLLGDNKSAKRVYEEVRCSSYFSVCQDRVKRETNLPLFMIPPKVLSAAPNDGFAKVHYGFILKSENKIEESIPYLRVMLTHSLAHAVNMLTYVCFTNMCCLCLGGFGIWRSRYWWWKVLLSPGRCLTADGRRECKNSRWFRCCVWIRSVIIMCVLDVGVWLVWDGPSAGSLRICMAKISV